MKMYFMIFGFPVKKIINGFELLCRQATNNSNWSFGIKIQFWEEEKIQWWQLIKTTTGVSVSSVANFSYIWKWRFRKDFLHGFGKLYI